MRLSTRYAHSESTSPASDEGLSAFAGTTALILGYFLLQFAANLTVLKTVPLVEDHPIAAGSLLYAISFTWVDLVNQRLGPNRARVLVFIAVAANLVAIAWFEVYLELPGTSQWEANPSNQQAIELVLGSVPRIYAASLITSLVVENVDITIFHFLRARRPSLPRWARSALSNTVSAPLDGAVFALLAFLGNAPGDFVVELMVTSAVYKLAVGWLSVPLVYLTGRR